MHTPLIRKLLAGLVVAAAGAAVQAAPTVIYDSLGPAVPNLPSQPYQAQATSEFGDRIGFAGTARALDDVTLRLSSWALASTYGSASAGYSHDMTLNIYAAGTGASHGALLASKTIAAFIPWRPEANGSCGAGDTRYMAADGNCYNGMAFDLTFDFSSDGIVLPDSIVIGLAFNTQTYGSNPEGANGPYNSLNFALAAGAPTVGTDVNPEGVFWNTSNQGFLGTGTAGTFGEDTDPSWRGYVPAIQVTAVDLPEPASLALVGVAILGLGLSRRARKA